jgi:hypothetical protein
MLHRSDEKDTLPFTLFAMPADFKSKAVYSHGLASWRQSLPMKMMPASLSEWVK